MKLQHIACALCGEKENFTVLYESNFDAADFTVEVFSARRLPDKIHYRLVRCNQCGLVRSTPTVEVKKINTLYEESELTYDSEVENLIRTYRESMEPIVKKLTPKSTILEIGCGNAFVLKSLYDDGFKNVFGVEPSKDAIAKADKRLQKKIAPSIFKKDLYKPETFDFIFILQTLDHLPDPNGFLEECYKILKPDGYLFAFNHNVESVSAKVLGEKSPIFDIEHTFLYSPTTIRNMFQKHSFTVHAVRFPTNVLSLRHLIHLLPIPRSLKVFLLAQRVALFDTTIRLPLGNISIEAQKEA